MLVQLVDVGNVAVLGIALITIAMGLLLANRGMHIDHTRMLSAPVGLDHDSSLVEPAVVSAVERAPGAAQGPASVHRASSGRSQVAPAVVSAGAASPQAVAGAPTALPAASAEVELSGGCPARADVRGNLGPAGVVTKAAPGGDWLKDRWQTARDMSGTPLQGEHWLEVDLGRPGFVLARAVLDFEMAHAKDYILETAAVPGGPWHRLAGVVGSKARDGLRDLGVKTKHQHVIHVLEAATHWSADRL
eukprot:CAMPEP_0177440374 /NCGR_PEP_ID=MMETSP0369-20130122/3825_1 /TAXON_ID=447022 ORGANISM="Scrippsiella hangoei-like, Strain SHHI-4" /NCGR_SAMPLE_ID=MMETSP0369 /ASSEMBLY_ACC=CAM_ASM_000364 /LENGTH=246 /DNA_ID=CAMNT_0018912145 /DNA_START=1 /DNA_END=739 /DNA_ORIENTATION=-